MPKMATSPMSFPSVNDETGEWNVPYTFQFPLLYRRSPNGSLNKRTYMFDGNQLYSITGVHEAKYSKLDVKLNSSGRALHQQAYIIARASYIKNRDKGYSLDPDSAVAPTRFMLGKSSNETVITYPAFVNPKYDGVRCRAVIENGKVVMYTRGGKVVIHLSHIRNCMHDFLLHLQCQTDGELWSPLLSFQQIESIIGSKLHPHEYEHMIGYYIYDLIVENVPYEQRYNHILKCHGLAYPSSGWDNVIKIAPTQLVYTYDELNKVYEDNLKVGMEGVMIRYPSMWAKDEKEYKKSLYHGTKCHNLVKLKPCFSDEAIVVGVEENTGELAGTPLFQLTYIKSNPYINFSARCNSTIENQRQILINKESWIHKTVMFHHNGITDGSLNFRHPRVICERTLQ